MNVALYDRIGSAYAQHRRPDPRIAARINSALGACRSVLNIGAGAGSYEPLDRFVVAIEPSTEMLRQRARDAALAVQASATRLPVRDQTFEATLAVLTIHHWPDWRQGLREMRRVARDRVVIVTWDPSHTGFWLVQDYFPAILSIDRSIFPRLDAIEQELGSIDVLDVPIPADCSDGFLGAYWRRPGSYLDPAARDAISSFSKLTDSELALERLRRDLVDGRWDTLHRELLDLPELDLGYRIVVHQIDP